MNPRGSSHCKNCVSFLCDAQVVEELSAELSRRLLRSSGSCSRVPMRRRPGAATQRRRSRFSLTGARQMDSVKMGCLLLTRRTYSLCPCSSGGVRSVSEQCQSCRSTHFFHLTGISIMSLRCFIQVEMVRCSGSSMYSVDVPSPLRRILQYVSCVQPF